MTFNVWMPTTGCAVVPLNILTEMQPMTIVTSNQIPALTFLPAGGLMMLIINGATFTPDDGSFTVSGQAITWTSTIYSVNPGDTVVAIYSYMG